MEGRSLLELTTGKIYHDISTKPTIPNAVTLYEKLSIVSIRELPRYIVAFAGWKLNGSSTIYRTATPEQVIGGWTMFQNDMGRYIKNYRDWC